MSAERTAAARLACAWLLAYPDEVLAERLPEIRGLLRELPSDVATSLAAFLDHLETADGLDLQQHYGPASTAGMGSAVFYEAASAEQIEAPAIAK